MSAPFPGPKLDIRVRVDGMVELMISHGDGREPSVIALDPDHAKWVAEQIRDGACLAEKHTRWGARDPRAIDPGAA